MKCNSLYSKQNRMPHGFGTDFSLTKYIDTCVNASRQTMISKGLVGVKPCFEHTNNDEWVCINTGYAFKCATQDLINNYAGTLVFKNGRYIFYARS